MKKSARREENFKFMVVERGKMLMEKAFPLPHNDASRVFMYHRVYVCLLIPSTSVLKRTLL
jgi:hypothetical protein